MSQAAQKLYTPAEYLALEETAKYKSEYYRSKIYSMAVASLNHNRITRNLTGLLFAALSGVNCETFAGDMRLLIEVEGLYTYPDVMVVCGNPILATNSDSTLTNPLVIFLEIELSLKAIYERVEWPTPSSTHPEQSN